MHFPGLIVALIALVAVLAPGDTRAAGAAAADNRDADNTPVNARLVSGEFDAVNARADGTDLLSGGLADRAMVFTGFDIWRGGFSSYAGMQWAPSRLDRDGFILRMTTSGGIEKFASGSQRYQNHIFRAALMPGTKFKRGNLEVQLLAGIGFEQNIYAINNRGIGQRSTIGAQATADLWWEPTRQIMAQASISASTIDSSANLRIAAGWRMMDRFWIGPEVLASRSTFSQQYRIGAHLTGLRTGALEWAVAAGYIADDLDRDGAYARVGMFWRWGEPLIMQ